MWDYFALQWSHRLSAMETRGSQGLDVGLLRASMEQPPFGDGNRTMPSNMNLMQARLQWSHRLSAMETTGDHPADTHFDTASMEPPPFGDGNVKRLAMGKRNSRGFNGATAFRRWKQDSQYGRR